MSEAPKSNESALLIAHEAHDGKFRDDGRTPYIFHPIRVAQTVRTLGGTDTQYQAALLHDVIEDCEAKDYEHFAGRIRDECGQEVLDLALVLAHGEESYDEYIEDVLAHPQAVLVKLADIIDNLTDNPSPKKIEKYKKALWQLLQSHIPETDFDCGCKIINGGLLHGWLLSEKHRGFRPEPIEKRE